MITIRDAKSTDAKSINRLSIFLGYPAMTDEVLLPKLQHLLDSETNAVFVALNEDETVVAWLHLFFAPRLASADFYEIGGLVVDPSYRGQQVGRKLVQYARGQAIGKLRVRCHSSRLDTHLFYEAIGFSSNKTQKVFDQVIGH